MMKDGRQRMRWKLRRRSRMTATSPSPNTAVTAGNLGLQCLLKLWKSFQIKIIVFLFVLMSRFCFLCEFGSGHKQHGGNRRRGRQSLCLESEWWRSSAGVHRWGKTKNQKKKQQLKIPEPTNPQIQRLAPPIGVNPLKNLCSLPILMWIYKINTDQTLLRSWGAREILNKSIIAKSAKGAAFFNALYSLNCFDSCLIEILAVSVPRSCKWNCFPNPCEMMQSFFVSFFVPYRPQRLCDLCYVQPRLLLGGNGRHERLDQSLESWKQRGDLVLRGGRFGGKEMCVCLCICEHLCRVQFYWGCWNLLRNKRMSQRGEESGKKCSCRISLTKLNCRGN